MKLFLLHLTVFHDVMFVILKEGDLLERAVYLFMSKFLFVQKSKSALYLFSGLVTWSLTLSGHQNVGIFVVMVVHSLSFRFLYH